MAKIIINGQKHKVKNGITIKQAVEQATGEKIPTLCFLKEINEIGFCRVCVVEVEKTQDLVSACNTPVENNMVIWTNNERVLNARKTTLSLLASKHRFDCWKCPKDGACDFYNILGEYDVDYESFGPSNGRTNEFIDGSAINMDLTKCILCKKCVATCSNITKTSVLKFRDDDGMKPFVSPTVGLDFDDAGCISCGACIKACPTGTLLEKSHIEVVNELLDTSDNYTVVQISKAAYATIAEEFGYKPGEDINKVKPMIDAAVSRLGFRTVLDQNLGIDIYTREIKKSILEAKEANEVNNTITSYCPASVRHIETYFPSLNDNLFKFKNPSLLQANLVKEHLYKEYGVKKASIKVVDVSTCTAIKSSDDKNVDAMLTVRELAKMLKLKGIKLETVETEETVKIRTNILETALLSIAGEQEHTVSEKNLNKKFKLGEFDGDIFEYTLKIKDTKQTYKVLFVDGGGAIKATAKALTEGKLKYDAIEMMQCVGACLNGGGAPFVDERIDVYDLLAQRRESLVNAVGTNFENSEVVINVYQNYIKKAASAEKNLMASYSERKFVKE